MASDLVLVAERVATGAALLDQRRPGWAAQVDPTALDMRCRLRAACVLCQLPGPKALTGLIDELGGPATRCRRSPTRSCPADRAARGRQNQ